MITIRSSKNLPAPALIGFEAILTTPKGVYEFSSNGPIVDPASSSGGRLFGNISWPRNRFRLGPDLTLEQQLFIAHDSSDAAASWELRGNLVQARLVVRPFFGGCAPRSYRDAGFRHDAEEGGGRLCWLPNVVGPRIVADTNGRYQDEPVRSLTNSESAMGDPDFVTPGTFEFELSEHPSILIFSDDTGKTARSEHVGQFLAGLLGNQSRRFAPDITDNAVRVAQDLIAA